MNKKTEKTSEQEIFEDVEFDFGKFNKDLDARESVKREAERPQEQESLNRLRNRNNRDFSNQNIIWKR
jgi:hypothetical protein